MKGLTKLNNEEVVIETTVCKAYPFKGFVAKINVKGIPHTYDGEKQFLVPNILHKRKKNSDLVWSLKTIDWKNHLVSTINNQIDIATHQFDETEFDEGIANEIVEIALKNTQEILESEIHSVFGSTVSNRK
jgi:hypothetical protein